MQMSRKGRVPVSIPPGVQVKIEGNKVTVKGAKGTLTKDFDPCVAIKASEHELTVTLTREDPKLRRMHGLCRSLLQNMIIGVTEGFLKELQMIGVGYRCAVKGNTVDVQVGFSHPMLVPIPQGVTVEVDKGTSIMVRGSDKHLVGQFAANLRAVRPPEPYKGKGIRYANEYVRHKAGKTAAAK